MKEVRIGNYFCFLDKGYKDTICVVDLRHPEGRRQRDLFTWNREKFDSPRGTARNKLNVPMDVVVKAFDTLNFRGFNYGKKAHSSKVVTTNATNATVTTNVNVDTNAIQVVLNTMIQNERINQERYNQTQERLNQLSEQNVALMNLVSTLLSGNNTTLDCNNTVVDSINTNTDCNDTAVDSIDTNTDCDDTAVDVDDAPVLRRKVVKRNESSEEVTPAIPEEDMGAPILTRKIGRRKV